MEQIGYTVGMSCSLLAMEENTLRFAVDRWLWQPANTIGRMWTLLY
jgi:hypothetical protein